MIFAIRINFFDTLDVVANGKKHVKENGRQNDYGGK